MQQTPALSSCTGREGAGLLLPPGSARFPWGVQFTPQKVPLFPKVARAQTHLCVSVRGSSYLRGSGNKGLPLKGTGFEGAVLGSPDSLLLFPGLRMLYLLLSPRFWE